MNEHRIWQIKILIDTLGISIADAKIIWNLNLVLSQITGEMRQLLKDEIKKLALHAMGIQQEPTYGKIVYE